MRTTWLLIVLAVGCGSKKKDDGGGAAGGGTGTPPPAADAAVAMGSGEGSGSGSAAGSGSDPTAKGPPCVKPHPENSLAAFEHPDDKSVIFCVENGPTRECFSAELASGTITRTTMPAAHAKPEWHAEQDEKGARVCKGEATGDACTKLDLAPVKGEATTMWGLAIKPDGKLVAATGGGDLVILDAATGKKVKQTKVAAGNLKCVAHPVFIGDAIYVTADNCTEHTAQGVVFDSTGKQLGLIKEVNVYGADPVLVDGTTYAVAEFHGNGSYVEFDAKTGKVLRTVKIDPPKDCKECVDILGHQAAWGITPLLKVGGKLVTIGELIAVTDPATGKVEKTIPIEICK